MTDRDLVRLHWPPTLRPAFDALFGLDDALGDVVTRAREPMLAAIKLAWWREQLQALDGAPPPAEPRLRAAAAELLPRGISGATLAQLEEGWAALLQEPIDAAAALGRGGMLFRLGARLLGSDGDVAEAGRIYAGAQLARRRIKDLRAELPKTLQPVARSLRPLTGLAALARRDLAGGPLEPEATPGRSLALLRHRLTGR